MDWIHPYSSQDVPATSNSWAMNRQSKHLACSASLDGILMRPQDLKNSIIQNYINVWQSQWNEQTQKFRSVEPTVKKWKFSLNITRRDMPECPLSCTKKKKF
ncbi:hypothetical protein JTB14_019707 [Gonioctena quinquepunctata]|nr:hypothetical protein JTB14_019707 [Gonioctena quinquepunctata]